MRRLSVCVLTLTCLGFLTGCVSRKLGFQPKLAPELSSSNQGSLLTNNWLATYHAELSNGMCADQKTPPTNGNCPGGIAYPDYLKGLRNSYIEAIRSKIDEGYSNFRASLYSGNAVFGMASDWAVIGLSGAGSVVADAGLKSILAVASGGVTGAAASYQKQVLNQQSAIAIASAMEASRAAQYVAISQSETLDVTKYSLENGIADLRKYYDDGTMLGGILYIQGQMQNQAQSSQTKSQDIKTQSNTGPTIVIPTFPAGTANATYAAVTLKASGGAPPYSWSIASGSLPAGLSLAAGTGLISGTPTAAGKSGFTVKVEDSSVPPQSSTADLSITIN